MKIAVMQPYFFPYIGYFQLINIVDKFVFYDDVNFIKGGWINRNKIIANEKPLYINIRMESASSFKLIKDINVKNENNKIIKTLKQNYVNAPFFSDVFELIKEVIENATPPKSISEVAGKSIEVVCDYLNLNKRFEYSSLKYADTQEMERSDRLIEICSRNNASNYINAIGGKGLYNKLIFKKKGINLSFIRSNIRSYKQFNNEFIPNLSIIDVLMFNKPEIIIEMLNDYEII